MCSCKHVCVHGHIDIHIHICIHTHKYTHTHTDFALKAKSVRKYADVCPRIRHARKMILDTLNTDL